MATKRKTRGIPFFKIRDAVAMFTGTFMLLYQTITWHINPYLVGAALTLLGFPSVVGALNEAKRSGNTDDTTDSSSSSPSPSVLER